MPTATSNTKTEYNNNSWVSKEAYECKQLLVESIFDPTLSGEIFEFLYNYINSSRKVKMSSYTFNDENKFIDIEFLINKNSDVYVTYSKAYSVICNAFNDLYRHLIFTDNFNKLLALDINKAFLFKDIIINNPTVINFGMFNVMFLGYNNEESVLVRITLV